MRLAILSVLLMVAMLPAAAEEPAPADETTIERALALRRELREMGNELEALLETLSPEQRAELERRWRLETGVGEPPESEAAPEAGAPQPLPAESAPGPPAMEDTVDSSATEDSGPQAGGEPEPPTTGVRPVPPHTAAATEPEPRCGALDILDTNGDGAVSGTDRYWRYLGLWKDDGDGVIESREVRSLYREGVRRVSARLTSYTNAKGADFGVWLDRSIRFDLPGRRRSALLVIDAGRLARGDELWLEGPDGARLEGTVALRSGLEWVTAGGERVSVVCGPTPAD